MFYQLIRMNLIEMTMKQRDKKWEYKGVNKMSGTKDQTNINWNY